MNRPIKFRHWHTVDKKMEYGDNDFVLVKELNNRIPMQFTGLTDRHGKEIYEGDIIVNTQYRKARNSRISRWSYIPSTRRVVQWRQSATSIGFPLGVSKKEETCIEVIGNIYENRDLLPLELISVSDESKDSESAPHS